MKFRKILSLLLVLATLLGALCFASCDSLPFISDDGELQLPLGEKHTQAPTEAPDVPDVPQGGTVDSGNIELGGSRGSVPAFDGSTPYVIVNRNEPFFEESDYTTKSYEYYGDLDSLKRCTVTMACIGRDLMPTEDRGDIANVKPTGWVQHRYDSSLVEGGWIYNRSHLIGFQLTGENDNKQNLITGTRFFNVKGMLPFENMVADYLKDVNGHVLYRVTPIFEGDDLLARGVLMEALSMEDDGEGVCFNVFVYNAQPSIEFNYATGENWLAD